MIHIIVATSAGICIELLHLQRRWCLWRIAEVRRRSMSCNAWRAPRNKYAKAYLNDFGHASARGGWACSATTGKTIDFRHDTRETRMSIEDEQFYTDPKGLKCSWKQKDDPYIVVRLLCVRAWRGEAQSEYYYDTGLIFIIFLKSNFTTKENFAILP